MANLLTDLSLTSAYVYTGAFADITGMSDTVTIAGTASVVLLMMSITPEQEVAADTTGDYRFTSGGSQVGAVLSSFCDTNSELNAVSMMFALTGLSAGSHTFAVQAQNRSGSSRVDTAFVRTFQVIEIESGAEILVDQLTTVANASPAAWANMTNLSGSATPQAGSVLIFNATTQLELVSTDGANDFRFAIDGTRDGPELSDSTDNTDEGNGVSLVWAETGVSAASHTFSIQWQQRLSTPDMDTAFERIFQVIEITENADLLVDVASVSADSAGGSYTDQTDMVGSPDIDSTDSIALTLWNYNLEGSGDDQRTESRFEIGGVQEGAELSTFTDAAERSPGCLMARAVTGETGVTDFAGQWIIGKSSPATDTARTRTFQVIDLVFPPVGAITASPALAFSATADLKATGKLDASPDLLLSLTADLKALGQLNASPDLAFLLAADLNATGKLDASPDLVFALAADLQFGGGAITASPALVFSIAADLKATGKLDASPALAFLLAADLVGIGALNASPDLAFTLTADARALAAASASPLMQFAATADLKGLSDLNASPDLLFALAADLKAKGQLSASALMQLAVTTADLEGLGRLVASPAMTFSMTADLRNATPVSTFRSRHIERFIN